MFKRLVLALALGLAGVHAGKTRPGDTQAATQMCCSDCGQNGFTSCSGCVSLQEDIGKGDCKGCGSGYYKADCPSVVQGQKNCYCTTSERDGPNGPCNKC